MTYDPLYDPTSKEARRMTRRTLRHWRWSHGPRWKRLLAAVLLAASIATLTGCDITNRPYYCMSQPSDTTGLICDGPSNW